jgi:hypothetical protein
MKAGKEQNDHAKDVPQVDREGEESAATVPALTHPFIPFFLGSPATPSRKRITNSFSMTYRLKIIPQASVIIALGRECLQQLRIGEAVTRPLRSFKLSTR